MSEYSDDNPASPPRTASWENSSTQNLAPNPQAILICDGLLGMCSPQLGKCEIGFLSLPESSYPELNNHKPEIAVISVENNSPETLFRLQWARKAPPFNMLRLRLVNGFGAARFFLEDGAGSGKDFREMIDLEHKLNDGNPVQFIRWAFSPMLEVLHGDFHTLLRTPETYIAQEIEGSDKKSLGQLAYMTAANLYCHPQNGSVVLEMRDEQSQRWVELGAWSVKGRKIFVVANNNCKDENGKKCYDPDYKVSKGTGTKTDFFLYYDAILDPPKIYDIICDHSPTLPALGDLSYEIRLALAEAGLIRVLNDRSTWNEFLNIDEGSTNPTPCGSSGFGASVHLYPLG
jgi:hypothetical protein